MTLITVNVRGMITHKAARRRSLQSQTRLLDTGQRLYAEYEFTDRRTNETRCHCSWKLLRKRSGDLACDRSSRVGHVFKFQRPNHGARRKAKEASPDTIREGKGHTRTPPPATCTRHPVLTYTQLSRQLHLRLQYAKLKVEHGWVSDPRTTQGTV